MTGKYKLVAVDGGQLPFRIATTADASFQLTIDSARSFRLSDLPTATLLALVRIQPIVAHESGQQKVFEVVAGFDSYGALQELADRNALPDRVPILLVEHKDAKQIIQADLMLRLSRLPHPKNAIIVQDEARLLSPQNSRLFDGKVKVSSDALAKRFETRRQLFSRSQLKAKNRQPILSRLLSSLSDEP